MGVIYSEKGEILSSFVGKNGNATDDRWLFQTELTEKNDAQVVEKFQHSGFASRPPTGSKIVVQRISNAYVVSVAEYDEIVNDDLGEGETRVYSVDSGALSAFINFLNTGVLELNGNADFAVSYTDLNTALQLLITSINAVLGTKLDGSGTPGALTLDLTNAKVDTVKLP